MRQVNVGDIVHVVMCKANAARHTSEIHRAAVVVNTWGGECVQLQVFLDNTNDLFAIPNEYPNVYPSIEQANLGMMWLTSVVYSEDMSIRTWHWPEE